MITENKLIKELTDINDVIEEQIELIRNFWNDMGVSKIKEQSKGFKQNARRCLRRYDIEKIKELTRRYATIFKDEEYFFNYKYSPSDFYSPARISKFDDDGTLWTAYEYKKEQESKKQSIIDENNKSIIYDEQLYIRVIESFKNMPYEEYLLTNHWRHFRKEVIKHYGGKCVICESEKDLNIHHKTYKNIGRETFNDVILLCEHCHGKIHGIKVGK